MDVPACARFEWWRGDLHLVVYPGASCSGEPVARIPLSRSLSAALRAQGWTFDWGIEVPCDGGRSIYALRPTEENQETQQESRSNA